MRCEKCDAELPESALFCIECGTPVAQASIGDTTRLPERVGGARCPACGTVNPPIALYCVNCGRALQGTAEQGVGASRPTRPAPEPLLIPPITAPDLPVHAASLPHNPTLQPPVAPRASHPPRGALGAISGGIFLIGLAFLFATGLFWPGILVLVGLTALLGSIAGGEPRGGIVGFVFMTGLALLFATNFIWPGILVLMGIMAMLSPMLNAKRRP